MLRMIFVLAVLGACGDNQPPPAVTPDAAPDAAPEPRGACIDRTTDLPRPPVAGEPLACDMLPPGLVLP
jgi:hypothetical protein